MRVPTQNLTLPQPAQDLLVSQKTVAAAPVALPAGAGAAAGIVAIAVLGGLGIGWNTLGPRDQAKAIGAVTGYFTRQVQSGKMTLGQLGGLISGLVAGGTAGAQGVLQRNLSPAQRKELERTVMAAAPLPTPEELQKIVDSLPTVVDCKQRPRHELRGQCGNCATTAREELRKLGIRAFAVDASTLSDRIVPGAHYVVEIMTTAGKYILDCTFGQFGGAEYKGPNTFFGTVEEFLKRLGKMRNSSFYG